MVDRFVDRCIDKWNQQTKNVQFVLGGVALFAVALLLYAVSNPPQTEAPAVQYSISHSYSKPEVKVLDNYKGWQLKSDGSVDYVPPKPY